MHRRTFLSLLAVSPAAALLAAAPVAADQPQLTMIVIDDMHCTDCAKRIASKLYAVPGVIGVRAEVKTGLAYVTPQQARQPSPRALWEAVEAINFKPTKLVGPYGTYTAKPDR